MHGPVQVVHWERREVLAGGIIVHCLPAYCSGVRSPSGTSCKRDASMVGTNSRLKVTLRCDWARHVDISNNTFASPVGNVLIQEKNAAIASSFRCTDVVSAVVVIVIDLRLEFGMSKASICARRHESPRVAVTLGNSAFSSCLRHGSSVAWQRFAHGVVMGKGDKIWSI
jgi:hypothetical protein